MQPSATFQASGIRHQLAHGDVEGRARSAERDVAEKLLPDHERHVGEGSDVEAGVVPRLLNPLDPLRQAAVHLADPDQSHPLVVDVSGLGDRRSEPLGDPDQDVLLRDVVRDPLARTEPVLERHDHTVGLEQRCDLRCRLIDVRRLGRDHPHVAGSGVTGRASDVEVVDDVAAAGTRDGQSGGGDRVDVVLPCVDGPHLVTGLAEEAGIHRAHRSSSDDCDLHVILWVRSSREPALLHLSVVRSPDHVPPKRAGTARAITGFPTVRQRFYGTGRVETKPHATGTEIITRRMVTGRSRGFRRGRLWLGFRERDEVPEEGNERPDQHEPHAGQPPGVPDGEHAACGSEQRARRGRPARRGARIVGCSRRS